MKKGYIVLEIGYEYNDEYYHTSNNGDTYEAPTEIFLDKEKAKEEMLKREIKSYKSNHICSYLGEDGIDSNIKGNKTVEDFTKYMKDTFKIELNEDEGYYFDLPDKVTDNQIKGLIEILNLKFHELHEITINE